MLPSSRPGSPNSRRTRAAASGSARPHGSCVIKFSTSGTIRATIRLVDDPVGPTMRRWADALADLGVGEDDLSEGVGLRYARALESFTHPS